MFVLQQAHYISNFNFFFENQKILLDFFYYLIDFILNYYSKKLSKKKFETIKDVSIYGAVTELKNP